jgi:hypothetical protein
LLILGVGSVTMRKEEEEERGERRKEAKDVVVWGRTRSFVEGEREGERKIKKPSKCHSEMFTVAKTLS